MAETLRAANRSKEPSKIRLISQKAPDYRLEFINGAICNITARGEIVCDFHLESKDRPLEQMAIVAEDGTATAAEFLETGIFTRDVKFGIVINAPFAKDLIEVLSKKINEAEEVIAERAKRGTHK
jgi:hypothetical protein